MHVVEDPIVEEPALMEEYEAGKILIDEERERDLRALCLTTIGPLNPFVTSF